MTSELICAACGKANPILSGRVGRTESCFGCGADLHACRQCVFFDRAAYNECREPSADRVTEKERANFCDYYQPRTGGAATDPKPDLLSAAEALFKNKPE